MRVSLANCKQLVRAIAPSGNLFLVLLLQELRRQGITFIAFYVLQRILEEPGISQFQLRRETGLENYEISRDCKFLTDSGLIKIGRAVEDRRIRVLRPTSRGEKIGGLVLSKAAKQLEKGLSIDDGFHGVGTNRQLMEATESFQMGNRALLGPLQLSFFDTNSIKMDS
jgi:DNA-binding MarR family transcriptional regulator